MSKPNAILASRYTPIAPEFRQIVIRLIEKGSMLDFFQEAQEFPKKSWPTLAMALMGFPVHRRTREAVERAVSRIEQSLA